MSTYTIYAMQVTHGLVYAMLLFLVASGLSLVFGMMRILNLAHGGFYMLGAYCAYAVYFYSGSFLLAALLAPVLIAALGAATEKLLLRPISSSGHASELLLTFGLLYIMNQFILWVAGTEPRGIPVPELLSGSIAWFGAKYPVYRLFILATGATIAGSLVVAIYKTRLGNVIRSTVDDGEMVAALGINPNAVRIGVFAAGAALAGFAGVVALPFLQADPLMAETILTDSFVVIVLGGFGSIVGALIASILVGLLQSLGIVFFPELAGTLQFALMALVLVFRPQGLLGEES
jgi:branched-chain amino acid transport system permease protein